MGNSLLRENRSQQNTQEIPWNLRNPNFRRRTSRCWDHHIAEGCFCLPWKKLHFFKARQDSQKKNERTSSATSQDKADQSAAEELCYTLINHSILRRRPSGASTEGYYENVLPQDKRPRELVRGNETEYLLLRVPSTPRHLPSPENDYEFLMPSRISANTLQQTHLLTSPSEAQVSYL
ncbi:germinal center-associated signaling and motility protein isoform 2-T2 [Hipposideros larvatus]